MKLLTVREKESLAHTKKRWCSSPPPPAAAKFFSKLRDLWLNPSKHWNRRKRGKERGEFRTDIRFDFSPVRRRSSLAAYSTQCTIYIFLIAYYSCGDGERKLRYIWMLYGFKTTCQSSLLLNPCQQHIRTHLPIEPYRRLGKKEAQASRSTHHSVMSCSNGQAFTPTDICGQKNNYLPIVFSLLFLCSQPKEEKNFSLGWPLFAFHVKKLFSRKMQKENPMGMGGVGGEKETRSQSIPSGEMSLFLFFYLRW